MDVNSVAAPDKETSFEGQARAKVNTGRDGAELFIVDNSDSEWKGLKYLQVWPTLKC